MLKNSINKFKNIKFNLTRNKRNQIQINKRKLIKLSKFNKYSKMKIIKKILKKQSIYHKLMKIMIHFNKRNIKSLKQLKTAYFCNNYKVISQKIPSNIKAIT